jgi:hypothetical protein
MNSYHKVVTFNRGIPAQGRGDSFPTYSRQALAMLDHLTEFCVLFDEFDDGLLEWQWNFIQDWYFAKNREDRLNLHMLCIDGFMTKVRRINSTPRWLPAPKRTRRPYHVKNEKEIRPRIPQDILTAIATGNRRVAREALDAEMETCTSS